MKRNISNRYTDQDIAAIRAWSAAGVPVREQARRLGRSYTAICAERQRLQARGDLTLRPRPAWRPWTKRDLDLLDSLLASGASYGQMAQRLQRTRTAIILKCKRRGERLTTVPGVFTTREVAAMLGIGCSKTIVYWIKQGWLPAVNGGCAPHRIWRIQIDDLWSFMEQPEHWMAWSPERITDPDLRAWTLDIRRGKPRWLTPGEVAARFHVGKNTVGQWVHKGFVPAVRYGNWWIRADSLENFVIPSERPRRKAA